MTDETNTSAPTAASIPLIARRAHEIPMPKDWQAFQRNCVLLFRAELDDPHVQEYGRGGQSQRGIDILGRRNRDPQHWVGIQCRHIKQRLTDAEILKDCRAALGLQASLKEIIFATTWRDDTHAIDAAVAVEQLLRAEGHDLTVVVYGWDHLQTLIAVHPVAYAAFCPFSVATSASMSLLAGLSHDSDLPVQVAFHVVEQLRQTGLVPPPRETGSAGSTDEDPALHARIDACRALFKDDQLPLLAQRGLLALIENEPLDGKPWARFRIETNLGAIALGLGREAEGAARFEAAHAMRPVDTHAIANLALARTIQGRFNEAMDLARRALQAVPRADHAVAYLLQAAAKSWWQGDPETLIPADLLGSTHADLGLIEFLRRRDVPGWAEQTLEICRRHLDATEFKQAKATAVLSLALESPAILLGGRGAVSFEDINCAADDLRAVAQHCLEVGYGDDHDLTAYLNNAAGLLRLAGRHAECEVLLKRGSAQLPKEPGLRRLLALAQIDLGRRHDALATLVGDSDPENRLLAADLAASDDPATALACALEVDPSGLDPRLARLRWRLVGELALKVGNSDHLAHAVEGLRALDPEDVTAGILEVQGQQQAGLDQDSVRARLGAIAAAVPDTADMGTRYLLADELRNQGLAEEASSLLEAHVDLTRTNPAATLYLKCLAAARRDTAFRAVLSAAAEEVRNDPAMLWTAAAHAWNEGDLPRAYGFVEALIKKYPDNARVRLLKIEILARQNQSAELLAELDKPVEALAWGRLEDRIRVVLLLAYFGYIERATAFAYRLFLEHRDKSPVWMTFLGVVLREGRGEAEKPSLWDVAVVAPDVAVDVRYDDGEERFFVVEPDPSLRCLDGESWEPGHPLVRTVTSQPQGARFSDSAGRVGTITQLRHKYVARLHDVMRQHEARFPEIHGIRLVPVDVERPGGLDAFIAELKIRHDWVRQQQEQYVNGPWPLGMLAHRIGLDTIEVAGGLATQDIPLKVAVGNEPERAAAARAIRENSRKGCVLDLLAFWTAWRLEALNAIVATCGPIHLPRSVMDRLYARRETIDFSARDGLRSASYDDGKLAFQHVAPEIVREWRDDVDRVIGWAEANTTVCPLMAGENLPPVLREYLRTGAGDIFDSLILATQAGVLLVADDLPTREISRLVGGGGAWLHRVFGVALEQKKIDFDTFVRWSAHLVDAGHNYIGVSGPALARSVRMDAATGVAPGYLFKTLTKVIGGRNADPGSHVLACLGCLRDLWSDYTTSAFRQQATGLLLNQLVRERCDDYVPMLQAVLLTSQDIPPLVSYIHDWALGHCLLAALLRGDGPAA